MPRTTLSRKPIVWGCGAFAALGLVHGAVWLTSVGRLAARLQEQARVMQTQNWRVMLGSSQPSAWPRRAGLTIGPTSIGSDGLSWRAERVIADAALRWPGSDTGPISIRPVDQWVRFGSGAERSIMAQDLVAEVTGDDAAIQGTNLEVAGMFETQTLRLRLRPGSMTMSAQRLRLSDAAGVPGPIIDTVALNAVLTPPITFGGGLQSAAAWQAANGVIDLSEFTLTAGRARASGRATMTLDANLQPKLDGVMHVTSYAAELDDLVAAGFLRVQAAVAAKAVLGLLAAPSPDGGADIRIQVADGILTVAQFPLMRLPALEWSAAKSGP